MKDEKKNRRKIFPVEDGQTKKVKKEIDPKQQQEQEELFSKADAISPFNKKIDRAEIIELVGGQTLNVDEYILENYVEKSTHFYKSFYFLIADLLGVSRKVMEPFVKPLIVPLLKRLLIYGRFPNAIQAKIYKKNPYTGYCSRTYWNYQFLTKKADLELRDFINDFEQEGEKVLAVNGDIKAFISAYCRKFSISIQLDMFNLK